MERFEDEIIKRWKDNHVFNLEKDRFKTKRMITTSISSIDSYSMTAQSLYPYILGDCYNRYYKMLGENIFYPVSLNKESYTSYNFITNHYVEKEECQFKYTTVLDLMGIGYDNNAFNDYSLNYILKKIDDVFIKLYNKDIFYINDYVYTDSLGIKIYNSYEIKEENNCVYDINTNQKLNLSKCEYLYFNMTPYMDKIDLLINKLNISFEEKEELTYKLGKRKFLDIYLNNYKDEINLTISLEEPQLLGSVVGVMLNPNYIDVTKYIEESEQEVVNHYLVNGYQEGVFSGNYVTNPLTGCNILIFISYDFEEAVHPLMPSINLKDKKYCDYFGLDEINVVEDDLMINSDFLNDMSKCDAKKIIEQNFISEGMASYSYKYIKNKLVISKKEGYGVLIPLFIKDDNDLILSSDEYLPFYYNNKMKAKISNEDNLESYYEISGFEFSDSFLGGIFRYLQGRFDSVIKESINKITNNELYICNRNNIIEEIIIPSLIEYALGEYNDKDYLLYDLKPCSEETLKLYNTKDINFTNDIIKTTPQDAFRMYILNNNIASDFEMTKIHLAKYEQYIEELKKVYNNGFNDDSYLFEQKLYNMSLELKKYIEQNQFALYIEVIMKFFYEELLANKMSSREAIIYLKLVSIICPFTSQEIFSSIFDKDFFVVYEEWPFLY